MKHDLFLVILPICLLASYLIWILLKKTIRWIFWIFLLILVALAFLLFY
jgi:hypothetical protein